MSLNGRLENCKMGGCKEIRQPFANPSPTFRQPFANLFCQPLSKTLFPWTPGTGLETRVSGFLGVLSPQHFRTMKIAQRKFALKKNSSSSSSSAFSPSLGQIGASETTTKLLTISCASIVMQSPKEKTFLDNFHPSPTPSKTQTLVVDIVVSASLQEIKRHININLSGR